MPEWIFGAKHSRDRARFSDGPSKDFALFSVHSLDFLLVWHWAEPEALWISLERRDKLARFVEADDI